MPRALVLALLLAAPAAEARPLRVYLDAGHGYADNQGAQTARCGHEADFVLALANDVAARLRAKGLVVQISRANADGPSYPERLAAARRFGADAIVSLHGDVRGEAYWWSPADGARCLRNEHGRGHSVLWADRGDKSLKRRRERLAHGVATALGAAGFAPYDGADYVGLYEDDEVAGVFKDRRGLFLLRKPEVPSIIVEALQLLSLDALDQFTKPETRARFGDALAEGVQAGLRSEVTASR